MSITSVTGSVKPSTNDEIDDEHLKRVLSLGEQYLRAKLRWEIACEEFSLNSAERRRGRRR